MLAGYKARDLFDVSLIAAISVACIIPVLVLGPPTGPGDLYHHMQIAGAYAESFRSGVFFPSWIDSENAGYGSITVRFYPPLAHYTIAVFKLLSGSWYFASFGAFALWSSVGSVGAYLWSRDAFEDRVAAIGAALLFAFVPYHLNQYYNSFMWAEFVALSIMPFALLFTRRLIVGGNSRDIIGLGIAYGLLVLSNLPQLIIGSVAIAIYALLLLNRERVGRLVKVIGSLALGLGLSSYYWVRMVAEMNWLVISQPNTDPLYDFRNHFLFADFTLDDRFVWFASIFLAISLVALVAAIVASGSLARLLSDPDARAVSAVCVIAVLLMIPLTRPIWELLTPLQRVQFPWRFLSVLGIGSSFLIAFAISRVRAEPTASSRSRLLVLAGVIAITATFSLKQVVLGAIYTDAASFETSSESMKQNANLEHWLPTWVSKDTFSRRDAVQSERSVELTKWSGLDRKFTIDAGEAQPVRLGLMFYPHWRARVNGSNVVLLNSNGAVAVPLGSDRSSVELEFVEPRYTIVSQYVSVAAWLAVIVFLIYSFSTSLYRNTEIA